MFHHEDARRRRTTEIYVGCSGDSGGKSCILGRNHEFASQFTCQLASRVSSSWLCGECARRRSAPSYAWNRDGCAAASPEVDADQSEPGSFGRVPSGTIVLASGLCPGCGTGCLYDTVNTVFIRMLIWIRGPEPPFWKRVRLADGSWAWAEPDQGDI